MTETKTKPEYKFPYNSVKGQIHRTAALGGIMSDIKTGPVIYDPKNPPPINVQEKKK